MTGRGKRRHRRRALKVVKGHRETLERELLWNIALDGDSARREQLYRMLLPAANDQLSIVPRPESSLLRGEDEDHE
ncbi:MAG: hypothetical protein RLZZ373_1496 [Pseudomonadota bacterium]